MHNPRNELLKNNKDWGNIIFQFLFLFL